jgi:U3 small nucleolar RNA-associated protein 5
LSGLHATLTSRLALHQNLLQLSGRLDMVLSQIEMRSSTAPAPLVPRKGKGPSQKGTPVTRYVEGESESDEDEQMDVEIESGDDGGSVEDVELGGESDKGESSNEDEDQDEDGDDNSEDDDDEDDDENPTMNGFIDDEAEEYSEEEDESE